MWRLNTNLRNALLNTHPEAVVVMSASTISFGDGDGSNGHDTINDSNNGLGNFIEKGYLTISGSNNNDKVVKILSVSAGVIEVAAGELTAESAGATVFLIECEGGSYRSIFRNGTIKIFTGPQPTSADDAETGTMLCNITLASGTFTPGSPTNGINFGEPNNGVLPKEDGEIWSGENAATGTAGWFRVYNNDGTISMDGACATSGAEMNMTSTSLTAGVTTTGDDVSITMPAQ